MKLTIAFFLALFPFLPACGGAGPAAPSAGADRALAAGSPPIQLISARTRMIGGGGSYTAKLSGDIELENIAYQKDVKVVYDCGEGWKEAPARYVKSLAGNREHWAFQVALGERSSQGDPRGGYAGPRVVTQFALKYTVNGQTYWDNNGGYNQDYRVSSEGNGIPAYGPAAFGKNQATLLYATYSDYPDSYLRGTVAVRKLGAARSLRVVYTVNGWATVLRVPEYTVLENYPDQEVWRFSDHTTGYTNDHGYTYDFAVEMVADGTSYWDNNVFSNYRIRDGLNAPQY